MMKTSIERLADDKLRLDVEVPEYVLQEALEHTLVMMSREMRMPGFRPGKVPPQAVLARVGREAAVAQAVQQHLDDWYRAAVMASGIRPVDSPEIDFGDLPAGADHPFRFTATVEVAPKPKLPELSALEVDRPRLPDLEPFVNQVLEATLRGAGELKPTDEPAQQGDEVVVDFHCTADGEQIRGAAATGYEARIGEGRLLEELEQALVGKTAGTELEVPVSFPADHPMADLAGKDATFQLKLREVLRLELPELTDEVARKVSEFDTAAELRADIENSIRERLSREIGGIFRTNAVNTLAEAAEMTEPEALVERRQHELYAGLRQQLAQHGMSIEAYMAGTGQDQEQLFGELESSARDDLRRELVLLALAEDAGIEITEEDVRQEIREHVAHTGEDEQATLERVYRSGRVDMLRSELLIQRAMDYLVEQVKPVEVDPPAPMVEAAKAASGETGEKADEGGQEAAENLPEGEGEAAANES